MNTTTPGTISDIEQVIEQVIEQAYYDFVGHRDIDEQSVQILNAFKNHILASLGLDQAFYDYLAHNDTDEKTIQILRDFKNHLLNIQISI